MLTSQGGAVARTPVEQTDMYIPQTDGDSCRSARAVCCCCGGVWFAFVVVMCCLLLLWSCDFCSAGDTAFRAGRILFT
jgi:hypothetical protein